MKRQIEKLKKEKNIVILAHYYAPAEAQEIADFVGDSFYLAKAAVNTDADIIVFCGVYFMGESAKILNPSKKVLMPDITADCAMAHMASEEKIFEIRQTYDDVAVVCYINSSARLKCLSDICVTSSNAVDIVKSLPNKNIFFIPDRHLGSFVAQKVPEKNVILNDGFCPIHSDISVSQLEEAIDKHPEALVISHPECRDSILKKSDYIGSTAELIRFSKESKAKEFIVCTESGVGYKLALDNPAKKFFFVEPSPCCTDMKLNTQANILRVMQTEDNEITVDEITRKRALLPLEKMLECAK